MSDYQGYFTIEKVLGEGGFGKVYKVRSKRSGKTYALKVLKIKGCSLTKHDVEEEFEAMKMLNHRNIIKVKDSFECMDSSGRHMKSFAIQMEYCPSGNLTRYLDQRKGKRLPRHELLGLIEDLVSAVQYIHEHDIIHRDLKPDNILIDKNGILRITDFGLAKIMNHRYTITERGRHTRYYTAPEITSDGIYNNKVDIYSLGKIFITMATLESFTGDSDDIPERYGRRFPALVERCIEDNPRKRPRASTLLDSVVEMQ